VGQTVPGSRGAAQEGVYVLRGLLICGLVVTVGPGDGVLHASLRTTLPLFGGLAFGTALAQAEREGHTISFRWALHLVAMWLATLSPAMWGDREVLRTCAVSGGLAILIGRGGRVRLLAWAGVAIGCSMAALASSLPSWAQWGVGELQYALGVAWPRGQVDVVRDTALFLLGSWTARGQGIRAVGRWRGIAGPLRALGRMPLTTVAVQYAFAAALVRVGDQGGQATWVRPALVDGLLIAQLAFAVRWLRSRERGPCEHAVHTLQATYGSVLLAASRLSRRPMAEPTGSPRPTPS
jgi:hypothetical protein